VRTAAASPFWDHVAPLMASGALEQGTIMGNACVRVRGQFVAMPYHRGAGLVVKLTAPRVEELVAGGDGLPFAPAGRAFREWVLVPAYAPPLWDALLEEGRALAAGRSHGNRR
jgi:hypothetical protein